MKAWTVLLFLLTVPGVAAMPIGDVADVHEWAIHVAEHPNQAIADPTGTIEDLTAPTDEGAAPPPGTDPVDPGFAQRVRDVFHDEMVMAGITSLFAVGLGLVGFALVTRYVKPEEALANPQRSMLYGFIRGNPGVHLKRLSDEFAMKTSSILWHIRKLENAELVRSDRANGFRVFYPTAGGQEMKVVSRATTALQNGNAHRVFDALQAKPGSASGELAKITGIHAGTVRWHLRKLREYGLVQEIEGPGESHFFVTPLGGKAAKTMHGMPGGVQVPPAAAVPAK